MRADRGQRDRRAEKLVEVLDGRVREELDAIVQPAERYVDVDWLEHVLLPHVRVLAAAGREIPLLEQLVGQLLADGKANEGSGANDGSDQTYETADSPGEIGGTALDWLIAEVQGTRFPAASPVQPPVDPLVMARRACWRRLHDPGPSGLGLGFGAVALVSIALGVSRPQPLPDVADFIKKDLHRDRAQRRRMVAPD